MAASMGFVTKNYENYVGAVDFNEKEKALDILAHLDVVPVSDEWTVTKPFEPIIKDGPRFLQEDIWSQELSGIDCRTGTLWFGFRVKTATTALASCEKLLSRSFGISSTLRPTICNLACSSRSLLMMMSASSGLFISASVSHTPP